MIENMFTAAEFMDGNNPGTDNMREAYCKRFCKFRKKHKCAKHGGKIINASCDPVAEYIRQKDGKEYD